MSAKTPGHEVLHAAALEVIRVIEAKKRSRQKWGERLIEQIRARRGDRIPEDVRWDVLCDVARALMLLKNDLIDEEIGIVADQPWDGEELIQIMVAAAGDSEWVVFRLPNQKLGATKAWRFDRMRKSSRAMCEVVCRVGS